MSGEPAFASALRYRKYVAATHAIVASSVPVNDQLFILISCVFLYLARPMQASRPGHSIGWAFLSS